MDESAHVQRCTGVSGVFFGGTFKCTVNMSETPLKALINIDCSGCVYSLTKSLSQSRARFYSVCLSLMTEGINEGTKKSNQKYTLNYSQLNSLVDSESGTIFKEPSLWLGFCFPGVVLFIDRLAPPSPSTKVLNNQHSARSQQDHIDELEELLTRHLQREVTAQGNSHQHARHQH